MVGLLRVDTVRLLVRPRFYLVGLAISLVAVLYLQTYAHTDYGLARNACHATTQCLAEALMILLPLAAGVWAADLLALDRSTGFIVVLLSRSGSRAKYVLAKAVAMALVVAMGTGLVYALTFLVAAVRFPLWPATPADGASLFAGEVFRAHPLGYVLLRWALHALAATALAWTGLPASLYIRLPYAVSALPLGVCLAITYLLVPVESAGPWVPLAMIYMRAQTPPATVVAYWACLAVAALALTLLLFRRHDCHDWGREAGA